MQTLSLYNEALNIYEVTKEVSLYHKFKNVRSQKDWMQQQL